MATPKRSLRIGSLLVAVAPPIPFVLAECLDAVAYLPHSVWRSALTVSYVALAIVIGFTTRQRVAWVLGAFPLLWGAAEIAERWAWRSAFLSYPMIVIGHLLVSAVGIVRVRNALGRAHASRAPTHVLDAFQHRLGRLDRRLGGRPC